jgi:hypothetical protein
MITKEKQNKKNKIEILFRSNWSQDAFDAYLERISVKVRKAKLSELKKTIRDYARSKEERRELLEDIKANRRFLGVLKKTPSINKFVSFLNDIEFRITDCGASSLQDVIEEYERKNHVQIIFNPQTRKWVCRK